MEENRPPRLPRIPVESWLLHDESLFPASPYKRDAFVAVHGYNGQPDLGVHWRHRGGLVNILDTPYPTPTGGDANPLLEWADLGAGAEHTQVILEEARVDMAAVQATSTSSEQEATVSIHAAREVAARQALDAIGARRAVLLNEAISRGSEEQASLPTSWRSGTLGSLVMRALDKGFRPHEYRDSRAHSQSVIYESFPPDSASPVYLQWDSSLYHQQLPQTSEPDLPRE